MQHPQFDTTLPDLSSEQPDSAEFVTDCYRGAVERLQGSFAERRSVAIVIGEGRLASSFVIGRFLATLDDEIAVARITGPCTDAGDLMRQVVRAVGFDPKDMGVSDLQSVLRMFLSFQKGHGRRTIICMEQIQDSEWWVLDKIRTLVDLEARGEFGLMLILSGQPGLNELLRTRPLNDVGLQARQRIILAPFTISETTEYIRRRVAGTGRTGIEQAFHFQAISLIHELSAGVPDAVRALLGLCFELADEEGVELITSDLVQRAQEFRQLAAETQGVEADGATVNLNGMRPRAGRLIVQMTGAQIQEMAVRHGHILIGRSKLSDIHIANSTVSRYHALISYTPEGVKLVDLGSTNGTFVDGIQVDKHSLVAGETITLGNCRIEYILEDDRQAPGAAASTATGQATLVPRAAAET